MYDLKEDENHFYVLMEYCPHGKLFSKLLSLSEISENLVADIIKQTLSAVVYLHLKNFMFGNISP